MKLTHPAATGGAAGRPTSPAAARPQLATADAAAISSTLTSQQLAAATAAVVTVTVANG